MRALLVVNPKATATTARARDVLAHALASESRLEVAETKTRGHGSELAAAAVGEFDVVVALGGDGTVNEVVNGLLAGGPRPGLPALAVVPGGSTNVFARALGLPNSPVEATSILLDALRNDRRRTIGLGHADGPTLLDRSALLDGPALPDGPTLPDGSALPDGPGLLDGWSGDRAWPPGAAAPQTSPSQPAGADLTAGRWFTFNAGLGLDADVVRRVDVRRAAGRTATAALYTRNAVRQFFRTDRRRPALTLERPGAAPQQLGLALVCNTSPWTYVGTRALDPCPRASFDTGLDVFGLRRLGTFALLRHAQQALARTPHVHGRRVLQVHDAPQLVITGVRPLPFQLDGEDVGDRGRVVLTSVPGALSVVA